MQNCICRDRRWNQSKKTFANTLNAPIPNCFKRKAPLFQIDGEAERTNRKLREDSMKPTKSKEKVELLRLMLNSRLGDLREQSLIRQGKGWFHVSGMGHEALTVVGRLLEDGDFFSGYYRDRPIALGRGVDTYEMALSFFAKRSGASGGRQMPAHYSNKEKGIFSIASVVGASLLPACGLAWGLKLDGKPNLVVATVGDAGTRQGDFFEAVSFAAERRLPVLFLVEDNGIGISTATAEMNPLALKVLNPDNWRSIDGCDVDEVQEEVGSAMDALRKGSGPQFIWCRTERISSHSSADDQRKYRAEDEIADLENKDPVQRLKQQLIAAKVLTEKAYQELYAEIEAEVRADYERAFSELDPDPSDLLKHVQGDPANPPRMGLEWNDKRRMVDAINETFHTGLRQKKDFVFFGQDIEDPKGGVFSLTKGLSDAHPDQVFNSPLAEATIVGVAVGLAAYGKRPVFEIQFADYIWPGFNQLVTHLSTLHWRSNGEWTAPAVLYAPCGAYLPGGALWHSQSNESALAHFPGLQIAIPSTPEDAAGLFWTAMHANTPSIVLIPKHLMWHPRDVAPRPQPIPFGKARIRQEGDGLTLVAWGNCIEVAEAALKQLQDDAQSVELIDVRTVAPLDLATIAESVQKTGRLLVVQEDGESCSIGQKILSHIASGKLFSRLLAPPTLMAKPDVHIGYNPVLEYAALPDKNSVAQKIRELLVSTQKRSIASDPVASGDDENTTLEMMKHSFAETGPEPEDSKRTEVRVPILGEGITSAKVISLIAEVGETIEPDDALCEVETDKALFPIEASEPGTLVEWLIAEGDEVEVHQVIAHLASALPRKTAPRAPAPAVKTESLPTTAKADRKVQAHHPTEGGLSPHIIAQLKDVVPAHMTIKAGWDSIRSARREAKELVLESPPSPTVMVAWAITRAMERCPVFTCTVTKENTLVRHESFNLGIAVALPNDALDTAVVESANDLGWEAFSERCQQAIADVRSGKVRSKSGTPVILTSMGAYGVRDALPVVVPPAIATLFMGEAHLDATSGEKPCEKVSLCLSFDHRWANGVAGAQFMAEVRKEIEGFALNALVKQQS